MSKPRNKKYSPHARAVATAQAYLKNRLIAYCGTKLATVYKIASLKQVKLTQLEALAISEVSHKWNIYLLIMCRDHCGRDYTKAYPMDLMYCKVDLINDYVQKELVKWLKEANEQHVVNIGWIATGNEYALTEQQIDTVMTDMGAFEFLAKHETSDESVGVELAVQ